MVTELKSVELEDGQSADIVSENIILKLKFSLSSFKELIKSGDAKNKTWKLVIFLCILN